MTAIKTGLASFGLSGQAFHAPFISTNPHFELSKIVERSKDLSKTLYPSATIVRSFEELLNDEELELIIVNTPDSTHYEYAKMALNKGKHVIVEKPFTPTLSEAEELIAIAEAKRLTLCTYQNRRWDSDFSTVKEILDKGLIGNLVEFESTIGRYRNYIKNSWKETEPVSGGITYDIGAHIIDQALHLFGRPESIFADIATLRNGTNKDDYFVIHFYNTEKAPNVRITLKASFLMREPEPRFILHGTLGSFVKSGVDRQEDDLRKGLMPNQAHWGEEDSENWGILHSEQEGKEFRRNYPSLAGNYNLFYENIYDHIRHGFPLAITHDEMLNVIRLIESAYKSSDEKRIIKL
ncbi:MAG: Gfo/Idh/MocA family oxidoreductase [Dysgonomonas sp.]